MSKALAIDLKEFHNRLVYDPLTGQFTHRWMHPDHFAGNERPSRDANRHNTAWAGKVAGYSSTPDGRLTIAVSGVVVHASVLAMLVTGNYIHGLDVDHINGDPSDNRLQNLRMATRRQNLANADRQPEVQWEPERRRWRARVSSGGRRVNLGRYRTKGMAMLACAKWSIKEHGLFSVYARKVAFERNIR